MLCVSYAKSCRDIYASKWTERVSRIRNVKRQTASFNDFCQFVSKQADLATDPINSEEGISKPMDTVDKYHKQNERKTKRGRGNNFGTGLSGNVAPDFASNATGQ